MFPTYLVSTFFLFLAINKRLIQKGCDSNLVGVEELGLTLAKLPPIACIGLISIGKRYLEILELSELIIEKAIIER